MDMEGQRTQDMTFKERLKYIMTRWNFVIYMAVMTCMFVTVTGVNFWFTDYYIQVLGVEQGKAF